MDELIPGVIADAVDAATVTEVAWQMAYGEGVTYEDMLAARREILLGAALAVAPAVAAAERERIRQGLAPIAERYRNAGVFAHVVLDAVRDLIGDTP